MGKPHRRFSKEFEAEAVRLVETSGRTQREIAEDLEIGLSTLRRWIDKRRERDLEAPASRAAGGFGGRTEAVAARERDLPAGARDPEEGGDFFRQGGKSMRFRAHRCGEKGFPRPAPLQGPRRQLERIFRLEGAPGLQTTA